MDQEGGGQISSDGPDQRPLVPPPSSSTPPPPPPPPSLPPSNFSSALSTWRETKLPEIQSTLRSLAPQLVESQKQALVSRKSLAEQTRGFKKLAGDEKLEAIKPLLKAYQQEIDALTLRSKSAENALLKLQASTLCTAPDPYPLLEVILEQAESIHELESIRERNQRLKEENEELVERERQSSSLRSENQRLTARVDKLEAEFERRLQEAKEDNQEKLAAKWDERLRNLAERESDLARSLSLAREQLSQLRSNNESATARLIEKGQEEEERETSAKLAELEMITADLERANARVEMVERRNEELRAEIQGVRSGREEAEKVERLERERLGLEKEIDELQQLVVGEKRRAKELEDESRRLREEKLRVESEKRSQIDSLTTKLGRFSDYDEIKRELEIVKMVEFSGDNDRDDQDGQEGEGQKDEGGGGEGSSSGQGGAAAAAAAKKPLEALLLEKNRKLQDELTNLRVAHNELLSSSSSSNNELTKLRSQVARLRSLNEKLENDLVSVGPTTTGSTEGARSTAGPVMSAEEALEEMEKLGSGMESAKLDKVGLGQAAPFKLENSNPVPKPQQQVSKPSTPLTSTTPRETSDTSILPIITSQRDRFRARNAELEDELRKQFETITELRNEVKRLQTDNLELYEKLRYLQSYASPSSSSSNRRGGHSTIQFGGDARIDQSGAYYPPPPPTPHSSSPPSLPRRNGGVGYRDRGEDKYRAKYEESMNPFEAFRGREQNRAIASLNPLERVLHMITRTVLGHRRMRLLFMLYAVCLHLLVFGMLFEVGHR
ncbi:hypothetical protein IE53DRAFT_317069 [Violaceomyces palustris]|uniref:Uncharacterized protein n=1 Tax=Violaceomyces palustris TaxID=1673888 RepID=A0ACD0NVF1_9BASI|nr:hypothetical protein IE53DRAFT_317069 [Violaceomyces palustris]